MIQETAEDLRAAQMIKGFRCRLHKIRFALIAATILLLPLTGNAEALYTQASVSNLRAGPAGSAEIVARLPIGTFVTTAQQSEMWVQVSVPMAKPVTGWLHRDVLVGEKPSLGGLVAAFERTDPQDLAERLKWLERAAAVAPGHTPVLLDLAKTLEALGENDKAESVRRSIADMAGRADPQDTKYCRRGLDGLCATLYFAPDSFHDMADDLGVTGSDLSCRGGLIEIFRKNRRTMAESNGLTPDSMQFSVPAGHELTCTEFENNLHLLVVTGKNQVGWSRRAYPVAAIRVTVKAHDAACYGEDYVVTANPEYGPGSQYLLVARSQSVPTTRAALPYFEVALGQTDSSGKRTGVVGANPLAAGIWTEETTEDEWIGEPGAPPQTVRSRETLYLTLPGSDEPHRVMIERGLGKYSYSEAFIESVHITDLNGDGFVDVVVSAANAGRLLMVSRGLAANGRIVWETHKLKAPIDPGVGGC